MSYVKESRLKGSSPVLKAPRAQQARQKSQRRQIVQTTISRPYRGTRWLVFTIIGLLMIGSNPALGVLISIICGCRYYTVSKRLKNDTISPPSSQ